MSLPRLRPRLALIDPIAVAVVLHPAIRVALRLDLDDEASALRVDLDC